MAKYTIKQGFITQKIGKKTTIFSAEESVLFTLNESAAFIFNGIKLGWDKKKMVEKLAEKYDVSIEKAQKDATELLQKLEEKGIIAR